MSAASLAAIPASETPAEQRPARQSFTQEIRAGLRLARAVAVSGSLANFVLGGYHAVIVVFLARQVGLAPALIGVPFTVAATGGLVGSPAAARLAKRVGTARVMWGAPAVTAACGLLIPLTSKGSGVAWYVAGAPPLSLGIAVFNVCVRAAMQTAAPDAILGRVAASVRLFSRSAIAAGALAADGAAYRIVKVPHQPADLEQQLDRIGWRIKVNPTSGPFYWGSGNRPQPAQVA